MEEEAIRPLMIEYTVRLQLLPLAAGTLYELPPPAGGQTHDNSLNNTVICLYK